MYIPTVVLIGKPNVGKSTIFNRLLEEKKSITSEIPGTTRDRVFGTIQWNDRELRLVDTAGLFFDPYDEISSDITEQVYRALEQADVILFIIDGSKELTDADYKVAQHLRKNATLPIVVVANKVEHTHQEFASGEVFRLGFPNVMTISGMTGRKTGDLLDALVSALPPLPEETPEIVPEHRSLAIVGRPNVGKSTLLNALVGEQRVSVSAIAGTTRDAIDVTIMVQDKPYTIIDTAGIRRKGKQERGIEFYSVLRALQAIERSDIVLLVVDAHEGITHQDMVLLGEILEHKKAPIIIANKIDLLEREAEGSQVPFSVNDVTAAIKKALKFTPWIPVVPLSAQTKKRVHTIWDTINAVRDSLLFRVSPTVLKKQLALWKTQAPLPQKRGKSLRVISAIQEPGAPPSFLFRVNDPEIMHFSYERFLENKVREEFGFSNVPVVVRFQKASFGQ